ncbi:MAG: thioredoxin domain-containing protein, partial [Patescibacteria group bacterium]|nr:thioredoxin domain-containing protein [Patescibacteria group bacterium]
MTTRKFYIAFAILVSLVILTLVAFTLVIALPMLQKMLGVEISKPKITFEKPLVNPLNPVLGPNDAKLKIVEFSDFLCPICKQTSPEIKRLAKNYPDDVQIIWKNFPNTQLHPTASIVAIAAQCANEQDKFWEYHDLVFKNQSSLADDSVGPMLLGLADVVGVIKTDFIKCLSSPETLAQITKDFEEGRALSIDGTPYLFINDVIKISGSMLYEELQEYLQ